MEKYQERSSIDFRYVDVMLLKLPVIRLVAPQRHTADITHQSDPPNRTRHHQVFGKLLLSLPGIRTHSSSRGRLRPRTIEDKQMQKMQQKMQSCKRIFREQTRERFHSHNHPTNTQEVP